MKKINWVFILSAFMIFTGCASTKLVIEPYNNSATEFSKTNAEYENYWDAVSNMDFRYLNNSQLNQDHMQFTRAMEFITACEMDKAEEILKELITSSDNIEIKRHSKDILSSLLFFQSKWDEYIQFHSLDNNSQPEEENSALMLVKAYSMSPKEQYEFPSKTISIPVKLTFFGSNPVIEVRINGKLKKFWLDTGAGLTVIASDVAEECNITPLSSNSATAGTATSMKVAVRPAVIKDLKIGDLTIKNHPAIIIDKTAMEFKLFNLIKVMKIDGIIGWNAIQNMDIEIDYKNKVARIRKPQKSNSQHNFFWLDHPIITLKSDNGVDLHFSLDTGANESFVYDAILQKIKVDDIKFKRETTYGVNGGEKRKTAVIPELKLILNRYNLTFKNISKHIKYSNFISLDGVLGSDIAKKGSIRIDYLNGIFELNMEE